MKKAIIIFLTAAFIIISALDIFEVKANAEEADEKQYGEYEDNINQYDFANIDKALESENIDFKGMVSRLSTGNSKGVFYELFKALVDKLAYDLIYNRDAAVKIIIIAVVSSLFTNMSLVLKRSDMSETGFYVTYMLTVTVLSGSFVVMSQMVKGFVENIIVFMNALVPAFLLSVAAAGASASALGFSSLILLGIGIVEKAALAFIIPGINIYVVLKLLNNIAEEDYFSKFAELIKTGIQWVTKGILGIMLGGSIIQGIMLPSVDIGKKSVVTKLINMLPGGSAFTGVEGIVATTGNVIKNSIGTAGLIVVAVLCILPILKLIMYILIYKFLSAVVWPIADRRLSEGIDSVAEGVNLLYKITVAIGLMLFITIAIVCVSTNIMI